MEICLRVSVLPIDNDADMQMIAGRIPSRTYFGDGVVFVYGLPYADQQTAAVGIESTDTTAVIDDHIIVVTGETVAVMTVPLWTAKIGVPYP